EEIIPIKIDQHYDNAESTHDSSLIISSKIDSLLDGFAGELTLLKAISPRIDKTDCHPENKIRLTKRLLYDNSSPRPPEEFVSKNSNADIESFSPSPIPVEDSDSRMEEIDLSFNPDDPMPPGIEEDDDDFKRDILIHEELLDNYSLSLPINESFYFNIPSLSRPSTKPPDGERKPRKGQNRDKTGQKREAWRSREKFKEITVGRGRKTEQNAKRMAENANTVKSYSSCIKERRKEGPKLQLSQRRKRGAKFAHSPKLYWLGTSLAIRVITMEG
nr:hypothetical protein [Tanacetum cinerariifolium]